MKEITMYECSDGSIFRHKEDAEYQDKIIEKIENIFSVLHERPKDNMAIRQDKDDVCYAMDKFMELCKEYFPGSYNEEMFEKYKCAYRNNDGTVHKSHLDRFFSDTGNKAFSDAFYRFDCINKKSFIEYTSSFYANNTNLFNGVVVDLKKKSEKNG